METGREMKVAQLKEQVQRGTYRVDPQRVAEAIIRRLQELAEARDELLVQNRCS